MGYHSGDNVLKLQCRPSNNDVMGLNISLNSDGQSNRISGLNFLYTSKFFSTVLQFFVKLIDEIDQLISHHHV